MRGLSPKLSTLDIIELLSKHLSKGRTLIPNNQVNSAKTFRKRFGSGRAVWGHINELRILKKTRRMQTATISDTVTRELEGVIAKLSGSAEAISVRRI